jgi:hypothetical protein
LKIVLAVYGELLFRRNYSRGGATFTPESLDGYWTGMRNLRQEFERHEPAQPAILCSVDNPHASAAKFLDDSIVSS